jgi:hypothetical protein
MGEEQPGSGEPLAHEIDPADVIAMGMLYCPLPCWVKAWPSLEMLVINQCYEDAYGIQAAMYAGSTDNAVWGDEIASHFHAADVAAARSGVGVERQETFRNPKTGLVETTTSIKWPIRVNGNIVGIAGIITKREVGGLALAAPGENVDAN